MFRFPQRTASHAATPDRTRHRLRRAVLFGAAIVLLWLALQLAPKRAPAPAAAPLTEASEADDGVAAYSRPPAPSLFSAGNLMAVLLLAGGAGLAFFLRRRSKEEGGAAAALHPMGQMSLAPNQHLRLVRCGDDVLLLGVTSGQITLLKSYDFIEFAGANSIEANGEPDSEKGARPPAEPASADGSFARLLRRQVGGSLTLQREEAR